MGAKKIERATQALSVTVTEIKSEETSSKAEPKLEQNNSETKSSTIDVLGSGVFKNSKGD